MPRLAGHTIEVATNTSELAGHFDAWQKLADANLEDNVYLRPEFLVPAFEQGQFEGAPLATFVYENNGSDDRLVLVASFESRPATLRIPFRHLQSSAGMHGYLVRPLVARDGGAAAIRALLGWLDEEKAEWRAVVFRHLCEQSPVGKAVLDELQDSPLPIVRYTTFCRAYLAGVDSFEDYLMSLPAKRRQDYRRNRRRLSAAGQLRVDCRILGEQVDGFVDRFAHLEQQSWKGENSTALASDPSSREFLENISANFASRGELFACELSLDERPLAISHNILGGNTMFAFKIAFDAEFRKFSPGIQLVVETVRALLEIGVTCADGGNAEDSYMSQLFPVQQQFENVFLPVSLQSRAYSSIAARAAAFRHQDDDERPDHRA